MKEKLFEGLTLEQRKAVTHLSGPALVIAGAGTGKTKVLTHRIAYLIDKKFIKPEEVLALTFTEKAAAEMQERVDQLLPLGTNTSTITTFHSFTTELLRQYAHFLAIPADFSLLTQEEELVFLQDHLFELPLKILRPGSNPEKFLQPILIFFNRLKDEAISFDDLDKLGQKKTKSNDNAEHDEGLQLIELAVTYKKYEELLKEEGYLTFGHCITETIKLFKLRPSVLREVKKSYKQILIDEYQDTNWAQTELASLIAGKKGNIMAVGDDDQAIYRFRGAASSNLISFLDRFPKAKRVVLTKNFRSTQQILDTAYRTIQHNNPDRLEYREKIDKRLIGQTKGLEPQVILYDRLNSELAGITKLVQDMLDEGTSPEEIAVLTRTRNHANKISNSLKDAGIPVNNPAANKLYNQPVVKNIMAFLNLLKDTRDNLSFYNVFSNTPFKLDAKTFNQILARRFYKEDSFFVHTTELIKQDPAWINKKSKTTIQKVLKLHQDISEYLNERPTLAILHYIHQSGLYKKLAKSKKVIAEIQLEQIGRLFDEAQNYEERHRHADLIQFLNYLEIAIENNIDAKIEDFSTDPFMVNVMTIHQSKGLEFDSVIIAHCANGRFPSRNRRDVFTVPAELAKEPLPEGDCHLEEERRLFYVAMTRARKQAFCTASTYYGEGNRKSKISPFMFEAFSEEVAKLNALSFKSTEYLQMPLDLTEQEYQMIEPVPQFITVSQTDLDTYIGCPRQYRYKKILKIKVHPAAALSFGIAVHNTLRAYFDLKKRNQRPKIEELLNEYWISGGFESKKHESDRKKEGLDALRKMEVSLQKLNPEKMEWSFNFPLASGDRLRGRIDRVDRVGKNLVEIVDYKTGSPKEESKIKKDLQLGTYILAVESKTKDRVKQVTLDYVVYNKKVKVNRDQFELQKVKEKIAQAITSLKKDMGEDNFIAKPEKMKCSFCDFKSICPYRYTE